MPNTINIQNNFIGGLKTEFTGLNFPENAATDTDNCTYTLIGDITRREGIDYENNFRFNTLDRTNQAVSTYKWNNVGGDGNTQIVVVQAGNLLKFFLSSNATVTTPLSTTVLITTIDLNAIGGIGSPTDRATNECQYTDGNGYLLVFHPYCIPFYCTYAAGALTPTVIFVSIRDFEGVNTDASGLYSAVRPATLANDHQYNLQNQGWDLAKITKFNTDVGSYPSNSDVWWLFKNSSGVFDPLNTKDNVIASGPASKGAFIMQAFDQVRNATGTPLPQITATTRPKTGTWFQGRVWYTGIDSPAIGAHTFSENIYFSQIVITPDQFGFCYQVNDPSSEKFFDLLPTDGGVIKIQGCGSIYKLFPVQNGLLVFAANGIWFITGSQGIGFSASDYTVTKISAVQSISSTSFVSVLGYPMFWNEEGIYFVNPDPKGSGLIVDNLCIGTILGYYENIPLKSKKFARGDYNSIDFTVQWIFRSTNETTLTTRYEFDKILNFNTANKSFFPYSLPALSLPKINGILYLAGPGGSGSPSPVFKYLASISISGTYQTSFAEEHDSKNIDWFQQDGVGVDYLSYFVTGYRIAGKALTKWQPQYVYMFFRNSGTNSYKIQGIWDFANNPNSGRYSTVQLITDVNPKYGMLFKRHKIRGHGLVFQIKVASVDGKPFDIMGWSSLEQTNQGT